MAVANPKPAGPKVHRLKVLRPFLMAGGVRVEVDEEVSTDSAVLAAELVNCGRAARVVDEPEATDPPAPAPAPGKGGSKAKG